MPNDDDEISVPGPYLKKTSREEWLEKLLKAQKKIRQKNNFQKN